MSERKTSEDLDEGPSQKRARRIDDTIRLDMSTDEVQTEMAKFMNDGLAARGSFTSKIEKKSFQDIRHWIEEREELKMGSFDLFYLYPAFKEALKRLLTEVEKVVTDERNTVRIILVHGVPEIGKTSLAHCLSYLLALHAGGGENVEYLKLVHSGKIDDDVRTEYVTAVCRNNYVVVDQVNANSLILFRIVNSAKQRFAVGQTRVPIIMFTSGHYTPSEKWLELVNSKFICYKLISMEIDGPFVSKLRNSVEIENVVVSNSDLLEVTTGFARMMKCLGNLRDAEHAKSMIERLREIVYTGPDKNFLEKNSTKHFMWLAWYNIISKELPPYEEFTEKYCEMDPHFVEYLGYLLSDKKDKSDKGLDAILNMMDIIGDTLFKMNGYSEFSPDSYAYKYMHKKPLYSMLEYAREIHEETSLEDRHRILSAAFSLLTDDSNSQYEYVRGGLLENIITTICEKGSLAMTVYRGTIEFLGVKCSVYLANENDLCNLPLENSQCKTRDMSFWCTLNVSGKAAFRGFDFAYMETRPGKDLPVVEKLQLLQVTVNAQGKSKSSKYGHTMSKVLENITKTLTKKKLVKRDDVENVVIPYLVHPYEKNDSCEFRSSSDELFTVDVIGFPKKYFDKKKLSP